MNLPLRSKIKELLQQHSALSLLEPALLDQLASECEIRKFNPNNLIIKEGKVTDEEFYVLLDGELEVFISDLDGREYILSNLSAGNVFGETVMFGNSDRAASVRAITSSNILVIRKQLIDQLTDKNSFQQLYQKLHSQTLNYLKIINLKTMELIKQQQHMAIFMINLVVFLSIFSVAVPYFQHIIKTVNARWITVLLVFLGVCFLVTRLLILKIPLSFIGITTKNLKRSISEAVIISVVVLMTIIFLKYILIRYTATFHDGILFNTARMHALATYGEYRSNSQLLLYALIYMVHAVFQEILARGAIQSTFKQFLTFKHANIVAIILASLVFACAHSYFGLAAVLIVFLPGLLWGWMYERQGNIFGAATSHAIIGVCFQEFIGRL